MRPTPAARLRTASPVAFTLFAAMAGFATYFSMYAFRKPFAAATYGDIAGWHYALDFKIAIVISQVLGYATSKFIGIRVIAAMKSAYRARGILILIGGSWLALIGFAVVPPLLKVPVMFLNGLCLGMIWGMVFAYMEGRRTTEVLGAIICASFILSSGAVKSVGILLMQRLGVPPLWMPAATGAVFIPVLLLSVWGLSVLPPPDAADEAERVRRAPMSGSEVRAFLEQYGLGLTLLIITYVFATALRDFRDNFAAELWSALGYNNVAAIFTSAEIPVAAVALLAMGIIVKVHNNARAMMVIHAVLLLGLLLLGGSTLAFDAGWIGPLAWMVAAGAGLYVVYTPYSAMLFDRLVSFSGQVANAGFLIYVADSAGYAGSVGLLLWRNFGLHDTDWLTLFRTAIYVTVGCGLVLISWSLLYFTGRARAVASLRV